MLTEEQKEQMEIQAKQQLDIQLSVEAERHKNQTEIETKRMKMELVRLSKELLVENARSKPASEAGVTADDVKAYAETLVQYINQ